MAKIFISYKHDADPDVRLAKATLARLRQDGADVFIDSDIKVGDQWPSVIDTEIRSSDYLIVFLSAGSTVSEMVIEEVKIARRVCQVQGRPKILPVRVAHDDSLPYDLGAWLDRLQQAFWHTAADDNLVLDQLVAAIGGANLPGVSPAAAQTTPIDTRPLFAFDSRLLDALDSGAGAVKLNSPFYIDRDLDHKAKALVTSAGATVLIRGSRQSGKSSALARLFQHAKNNGQKVLFVDFQGVDKSKLKNLETLLRYLADLMSLKFKTAENPDRYWNSPLGPTDKLTSFIEDEILQLADKPVVFAFDEVDRIFENPEYHEEFFGLIRSWHNKRAFDVLWDKLTLLLAYSMESNLLIRDPNQSPFNVGEKLESEDFTRDQVSLLNDKHGAPLSPNDLDRLMQIVSGHPYLVRKALFEIVRNKRSFPDLCDTAANDDGPFGDHLQRYVVWLARHLPLKASFKSALATGMCDTDLNFYDLRGVGLIRGHSRQAVQPRCGLYGSYFKVHL